jgi:hypothetical protein
MRCLSAIFLLGAIALIPLLLATCPPAHAQSAGRDPAASTAYLGFDANDYPGDTALPVLRHTFAFAGYWLNNPPGASSDPWLGKRKVLLSDGFGFLVLFNGRLQRELKNPARATAMGSSDSQIAADTARREGFHAGITIFVDQEEGGEMEPEQMGYLLAWFDGIIAAGFRAGVYCSGIPASAGAGQFVITSDDIRNRAGDRSIAFFVYNDACPPSPGCFYSQSPPAPSASGISYAVIWQFAQSPRRKQYTTRCASTYDRDGNCYPPGFGPKSAFIDIESATSPDQSNGGR